MPRAWRRQLRGWWRRLRNEQATPRRLGVAVAIGVIVGCSPFWGLQLAIALGLAWALRLNKIAVLAGSQISTPPLTPFFMIGTAQIGELLLRGRWLPLTLASVRATPASELLPVLFTDMLVGSLVVGGGLGIVCGLATAAVVQRHRTRQSSEPVLSDEELDALTDRLERLPRFFRSYGWWKVRMDPIFPMALDALAGACDVVDLGAGMGLLEALSSARMPQARMRAIEWDGKKVAAARQLVGDLAGVTVEQGDARAADLGRPDAIVMLDVLHYVAPDEQRAWLARCADALAPCGVIVIRELDSGAKGKSAERLDRLAVRVGLNRGGGVHAWPIAEMVDLLRARGFDLTVRQAGRGMWSANAMITARKPSLC